MKYTKRKKGVRRRRTLGAVRCELSMTHKGTELGYGASRKPVLRSMLFDAKRDSRELKGAFTVTRKCGDRKVKIATCVDGKCTLTAAGKRSFKTIPGIAGAKRRK